MKQYGYDTQTGATFSWEAGLQFEGVCPSAPDRAFISNDRTYEEMYGVAFLSGLTGMFIIMKPDGETVQVAWGRSEGSYYIENEVEMAEFLSCPNSPLRIAPICVYGEDVKSPEKIAELCARFPSSRIFACSLVDELAALGVLVENIRVTPFRSVLAWENWEPIDAEFKTFEKNLNGDAMGRMADVVANGLFAVNEVSTTVGLSPFYGKTLHRDWQEGCQFIIRKDEMDSFFPQEPISAKHYAATSVPVRMETTEQFRTQTGYNGSHADVFVATDWLPDASTFMRFYKTISGRGYVCVSDQGKIRHRKFVPVFRNDRAYRVLRENYEQTHGFIRS